MKNYELGESQYEVSVMSPSGRIDSYYYWDVNIAISLAKEFHKLGFNVSVREIVEVVGWK